MYYQCKCSSRQRVHSLRPIHIEYGETAEAIKEEEALIPNINHRFFIYGLLNNVADS